MSILNENGGHEGDEGFLSKAVEKGSITEEQRVRNPY